MTNHWVDIKNADVVLIMGSNCAENHPVAFKWIMEAKKNGAKIISVDPRFTRTSSKADIYAPMRSGTDIAFLGGMIRYAINKWEADGTCINEQYVKDCTNALLKIRTDYKGSRDGANLGNFSASSTWDYQYASPDPEPAVKAPLEASLLTDADCVFQKLKDQYSVYTPDMVERICGTPRERFLEICEAYIGSTDPDVGTWQNDRSGTMLYAMGWTQHTVGSQNIRAATILQSLLGNMGVAGGGINALRGWHNVQGATDHALLYHYIPGYNSAPQEATKHVTLGTGPYDASDTYLKDQTPKTYMDAKDGGTAESGTANTLTDTDKAWTTDQWAGKRVTIVAGTGVGNYLGSQIRTISSNNATTLTISSNWGTIPAADSRYVIFDGPVSGNWWSNRPKYVISNLKAWWPTIAHDTSWSYLPKRAADYSYMSLMKAIDGGTIKGLFCWGTNPMVMGPDQNFERPAMDNLEWLVVCDLFETETSNFWKRPDVADPATIGTTVYLLPGAAFYEKKGSVTNSGRLAQWKDLGCNPPGDAKDELEILNTLGADIKALYSGSADAKDDPIKNLNWPHDPGLSTDLTEGVAKEIHGYTLSGGTFSSLLSNFVGLKADGTTACGNWLFSGTWPAGGNQMVRRDPVDYHPKTIGIYDKWGYSWPLNRRIIYNRASINQSTGAPLATNKWVINWNGSAYVANGDVVDGYASNGPLDYMPFIMRNDGVARHMGIKALTDGPFPEHWEPKETPLTQNILTGTGPVSSPYISNWYSATFADQGSTLYPIVCTTYRLSEHWHGGGMTRNLPFLNELMPEPFIEMSEELAAAKGINNGDEVYVYSARNPSVPITVKACKTKRFKPFTIDGQTIHQVGLPWHWGYAALSTGDSANILTPLIGDANTRIPEYKAFLVDIVKKP